MDGEDNVVVCFQYLPCVASLFSLYMSINLNDAYTRTGEHTLINDPVSQVSSLTKLLHAFDVHLAGHGRLVKAHDLSDVAIVSRRHLLTDHIVPRLWKSREGGLGSREQQQQ